MAEIQLFNLAICPATGIQKLEKAGDFCLQCPAENGRKADKSCWKSNYSYAGLKPALPEGQKSNCQFFTSALDGIMIDYHSQNQQNKLQWEK